MQLTPPFSDTIQSCPEIKGYPHSLLSSPEPWTFPHEFRVNEKRTTRAKLKIFIDTSHEVHPNKGAGHFLSIGYREVGCFNIEIFQEIANKLLSLKKLIDISSRLTWRNYMLEITPKRIEQMIYVVRGQKVMLDSDLAELYCVLTKYLNKAVTRNIDKFPNDFMFKLSQKEFESLRFQFGTFKNATRGRKYLPYVFTEYGIVALSAVLSSEVATKVNISIVRTFIKMRKLLASEETLSDRVGKLEAGTDKLFRVVFERLDHVENNIPLMPKERKKVGLK